MKYNIYIAYGLILLTAVSMQAQQADIKDYLIRSGTEALIYTGKEETRYPAMHEHPYMDTDQYREGELMYDGRLYPGVRLRLNTHTDELTILSPDFRDIIVSSELIAYARLPEYTILYSRPSSGNEVKDGNALPPGYYACITMQKHPVFRREARGLVRKINDMQVNLVFILQSRLYVYKEGKYHSVGSKGSVLKLFNDRRSELNRYAKQQRLNFRNDRVNAVVALVRYYESLTETL